MSYAVRSLKYVRIALGSLLGLFVMTSPLSGDPASENPDVRGGDFGSASPVPAPNPVSPSLYIEPIAGLTTVRHRAPDHTAIPLGTELNLYLSAPGMAQVTFTGASITSRDVQGVSARCSLSEVGRTSIQANVQLRDGTSHTYACLLDVVPIAVEQIAVTAMTASVMPLDLDEFATNEETMGLFFGDSIAKLQPTSTGYSTSTNREIRMVPDLNYPEFAPLMEWRINGAVRGLGEEWRESFPTVGRHIYSVGPPERSARTVIKTYSVSITSPDRGAHTVREGEPVTFEAVTDPPGFEAGITWLSSTKYGTAAPVVGHGPRFTVEFYDTFGPDDGWQWLGVKADNATFGVDQGLGLCCIDELGCVVTFEANCDGFYQGDGTDCDSMTAPTGDAVAGTARAPCPAGAIKNSTTQYRLCCSVGIGSPLDDTWAKVQVNAANVPAGTASVRIDVAGHAPCTTAVGGGATIAECHYGPCLAAGTVKNISLLGPAPGFAVLCTDVFTVPGP